jgi:hypothetical protein
LGFDVVFDGFEDVGFFYGCNCEGGVGFGLEEYVGLDCVIMVRVDFGFLEDYGIVYLEFFYNLVGVVRWCVDDC